MRKIGSIQVTKEILEANGFFMKKKFGDLCLPFALTSLWLTFFFSWCIQPLGLPQWLSGKESANDVGDAASVSVLGRSLGGGSGNPLQCSYLENPLDRPSLGLEHYSHRVTKSRTRLK